jgi:hypothetical protein
MDAEEVRRRVDAIIERQDAAMERLHDAGTAFDQAIAGVRVGLDGMRAANDAQQEVISNLRAANREALQILRSRPQ